MDSDALLLANLDEPQIWIYDPRFPAASASDLAIDPLADFDRPTTVVDKEELAALVERGYKIEFV